MPQLSPPDPKGPKILKTLQSPLKFSISLEIFNLDLQNSPHTHKIGVWWAARLKFSISLEKSNPEGDLDFCQSFREEKISPMFFRPKFFHGRPRGMSVQNACFFQHLEGLTEVFGRMSAGISGHKLPLWAEFPLLILGPSGARLRASEFPAPRRCAHDLCCNVLVCHGQL